MQTITKITIMLLFSAAPMLFAQTSPPNAGRVAFTLKNTLGYHRMFRAEGPGMAYGFTMNRNERTPKNWPVGSKLYFSKDGETNGDYILTVTADDAGKTLNTDPNTDRPAQSGPEITVRFRNNSARRQKVALITYKPGDTGNGTNIFTMSPFATAKRSFPPGTKVYFARPGDPDDNQVSIVMSGNRIDTEKPLLTVQAGDAGKTFDIFK